jgi:tricorn protease-like protein
MGCSTLVKDAVLQPAARDISSPEGLPESLIDEQIYWQDRLIYLSGKPVMENDPVKQLWDEMNIVSAPIPKFSHNNRYLISSDFLSTKILLWDLETNEKKWLIESGIDLPAGAQINGVAFMPNDDKVIFSYTWGGENQATSSDLALVDIENGDVESLNVVGFLSDFFEIEVSPDGKWAVTNMVTLNNRVCLLVNLETRSVECLRGEKGWYTSGMFLPDSEHIVYSHTKESRFPAMIILSRIDGTEDHVLVSGLLHLAWIQVVSEKEIVFVGGTYDNPACSYVYIINQDGSDLRRLAYLGEDCITDEEVPVVP